MPKADSQLIKTLCGKKKNGFPQSGTKHCLQLISTFFAAKDLVFSFQTRMQTKMVNMRVTIKTILLLKNLLD